jgi:hypothetical protein
VTTKEAIHRLLDELPESVLPIVEQYLAAMRDDPFILALANAPVEDEELSPEDEAALAAAWERYENGTGQYTSSEDLRREIGW